MRIRAKLSDFNSNLWGHHFIVPESVTEQLTADGNRRMIVRINDTETIRCSLMPVNKCESFILINKKLRQKLGLTMNSEATLDIQKDTSEFGMDMPDELSILLEQEDEAAGYFHQLTPGKQRSLIYLVSKVKNSNSRLSKALAIVHHLNEVNGRLDFKMLNQTIKYYNNLNKMST